MCAPHFLSLTLIKVGVLDHLERTEVIAQRWPFFQHVRADRNAEIFCIPALAKYFCCLAVKKQAARKIAHQGLVAFVFCLPRIQKGYASLTR